jgi:hypothetical protein
MTKVKFQPRTCGQHTVVVVAGLGAAAPATGQATVDVVIDPVASVDELITATTSLDLPMQTERSLVTELSMAKRAFAHHAPRVATSRLTAFIGAVEVQRGTTLTDEQADSLIGEAKLIISCV